MTKPFVFAHLSRSRQQGTVLMIALVFLLLMTLLGVAAMQGTTLQERMAGNHRDRTLAFQAAEAALRDGMTWLDSTTAQEQADTNDRLTNPQDWDGSNSTGVLDDFDDQQLAAPPVFYVERPILARLGNDLPPTFIKIFPVTARGTGGAPQAVVILRSLVEPPQ